MNIVLMTSSFFPVIGGKEVVVHNLLRQYSRIAGLSSRLVRTSGLRYRLKYRFPYSYHSYPKFFSSPELSLMIALCLEKLFFGLDIVHLQGIYPLGKYLIKCKDKLKFKLVVTPQGEDVQKFQEINYGLRLSLAIENEISQILNNADAVTAISPVIKKDIESIYTKHTYDIPNGVYVREFANEEIRTASKKLRQKLNIPDSTKIILAVGRNHRKKGFEHLINSVAVVKHYIPDVKLIIIGSGTEGLYPVIRSAHLENEVMLPGRVPKKTAAFDARTFSAPDKELIYYYSMSDVFVLPSLIEGCPVVTLEAMAAGKPVIATNLSGSADATGAIKDGDGGFLVDPGDERALTEKLLTILSDRDLRVKMGERARDIAQQFDWSRVAEKYEGVYQSILRGVRRSSYYQGVDQQC